VPYSQCRRRICRVLRPLLMERRDKPRRVEHAPDQEEASRSGNCAGNSLFSSRSKDLPRSLPPGPKRNDGEAAATATILVAASERFRTGHTSTGHDKVMRDRAQIVGQGAGVRQSTKMGNLIPPLLLIFRVLLTLMPGFTGRRCLADESAAPASTRRARPSDDPRGCYVPAKFSHCRSKPNVSAPPTAAAVQTNNVFQVHSEIRSLSYSSDRSASPRQ
jgi:hypothetical protein